MLASRNDYAHKLGLSNTQISSAGSFIVPIVLGICLLPAQSEWNKPVVVSLPMVVGVATS